MSLRCASRSQVPIDHAGGLAQRVARCEKVGFEVLALKGLGLESIGDPAKVSQAALQQFSADVFTSAPTADALLVSCGGLRTLELVAPLEKQCQVPVASSTPHALWAGMRLLGLRVTAPGYGRLLTNG